MNGADAKQSTIDALKSALESAGVIFLADGETINGGPGVRSRNINGMNGMPFGASLGGCNLLCRPLTFATVTDAA